MHLTRVLRLGRLVAALTAASGLTSRAIAQQTGSIRGTVTDSASTRGISGAQVSVTIAGTTRGALTNDAGEYTINAVPAGSGTARAQRIGFAPMEGQVTVTAGQTAVLNFVLAASARTLSEVVVVGYGTSNRANVSSAIASVTAE